MLEATGAARWFSTLDHLTARERDVLDLDLVATGRSNAEIAR